MAREQRRLAAILDADVVGYSRLMGRDESGTVARLRELRIKRLEPLLVRHGGRLIKLAGDGALIEFPSAVDALSAAIEFQQAMADANRDQPEDNAITFRIGLHLGDVIVDGDDLYGDAVNIADRLEAQAPPGGIVVSGTVREAVAGRLKATFVDHGSLTLKNIERPIHAFGVNWHSGDWPVPHVPATEAVLPIVRTTFKRPALWAALVVGVLVLSTFGYRALFSSSQPGIVQLQELKAEDLERLLAERRNADAAMAEKKRLEDEAKARAEAETATMRQAEAALRKAQEDRQRAEADLVKLRVDIAARREAGSADRRQLADSAARQTAEEEVQRKAEGEMATLRQAENEAQRKAAADAESKRKADDALAMARSERQKAEAIAESAPASGIVVVQSNFSVAVTVQRLKDAVPQLDRDIREIDVAAAREKAGFRSLPRKVIEFDRPLVWAESSASEAPTSALEGPLRVVVWQDSQDKVWLAYNSAAWLGKISARHGLRMPIQLHDALEKNMSEAAKKATQ
jgi:class 3 adenylate cyclase/uncharacterized protein (DUF302 family)